MADSLPPREASEVRDAATVIMLRAEPSSAAGFVTYMVKRPAKSRFMPGAYVFPGGRVESDDVSIEAAAVRETREETSVVLRKEDLVLWSRWVTPEVEPRRYDARFYLARVSPDTTATADPVETVGGMWTSANDMLLRAEAGETFLAPPTQRCLELLRSYRDADALLQEARQSQPPVIRPVVCTEGENVFVALPGDPAHPEPRACIAGETRIAVPSAWLALLQARAGKTSG